MTEHKHNPHLEITGYTPGVGTIDFRHEHKGGYLCFSRAGVWRTVDMRFAVSSSEAHISFCCPECGVDFIELEVRYGLKLLWSSFPKLIEQGRKLGELSEKLENEASA